MKKYSSTFLKSAAIAHLLFPFTYLTAAAVLFDIPANRAFGLLLSPSFWLLSIFAIFTGYSLWEMKRWSWYIYMATHLMLLYYSTLLAFEYGETHNRSLSLIFAWVLIFLLFYRISREIRVPYFLPKIRWWESNPRYRLSVPVQMTRANSSPATVIDGGIMDISQGGCFIKMRIDVNLDEVIDLRFNLFGQEVHCPGVVVWKTESTVTHPRGVGVKFSELAKMDRRILRAAIKRLRAIQRLYRQSRYLLNQADFNKKLAILEAPNLEVAKIVKKQK